ncbi:MAG TPA: 3'(2'),5'-bisphosphate nucleotidase CysQ [Phenylobacterium sp.]|uniref:3'(2'),5'-bisphosphate nucleotidase CysQ n=1 Tax=Phenylobacterium sp. TaxID=1871053 RepID=UPI002B4699DF|nr:3'(2'),5'-bisphosphate nucleotidase CysQ [Phenylobacterium sp.]HKR89459.1 3'(2'),5'-bisphosphate nucleotidase CysQ [Phenylobacterium sp.]
MTDGPADDLALIVEAAHAAGELAMALRDAGLDVEYKAGNSPVTNADLAADALLTTRLRPARPQYGWLSEETADDPSRLAAPRLFVVDPIDGTRAFAKGDPYWTVCVAVVEAGRPTAGVVFAPQLGETYAAAAGGGATLNGRPIHASAACAIDGCGMIAHPRMFKHQDWPKPWPDMVIARRNSTAYRLCLVASGAADATVTFAAKHDWDLAAADLIAAEAGAYVGDHTGHAFIYNRAAPMQPSLVCAAPALAPLILERVRHIAL